MDKNLIFLMYLPINSNVSRINHLYSFTAISALSPDFKYLHLPVVYESAIFMVRYEVISHQPSEGSGRVEFVANLINNSLSLMDLLLEETNNLPQSR